MRVEFKAWLYDILNAIHEIDSFLSDGPKDLNEYQADIKTKRAVERNLTIIGEAMNRILKVDGDFEITHARKIVDFRNRAIHGYDSLADGAIWEIVSKFMPLLEKEVSSLLNE